MGNLIQVLTNLLIGLVSNHAGDELLPRKGKFADDHLLDVVGSAPTRHRHQGVLPWTVSFTKYCASPQGTALLMHGLSHKNIALRLLISVERFNQISTKSQDDAV